MQPQGGQRQTVKAGHFGTKRIAPRLLFDHGCSDAKQIGRGEFFILDQGDRTEDTGSAQPRLGPAQRGFAEGLTLGQAGDLGDPRFAHPGLAGDFKLAEPQLRSGIKRHVDIKHLDAVVGNDTLFAYTRLGMPRFAPCKDSGID